MTNEDQKNLEEEDEISEFDIIKEIAVNMNNVVLEVVEEVNSHNYKNITYDQGVKLVEIAIKAEEIRAMQNCFDGLKEKEEGEEQEVNNDNC